MRAAPPWSPTSEPLDWDLTAADVLRLLRADAHPAALLGTWAGGSDIVIAEPCDIRCDPESVLAALDEGWPAPAAAGADTAVFAGGWVGYLGFGLGDRILPVPPAPGDARRLPLAWLGYYDHALRRDRASGRWFFEALRTPGRADALDARLAELRARAGQAARGEQDYRCGQFQLIPGASGHRSAVRRTVDYIRAGDIFQANICLRLEAEFDGDPLDAFCTAATRLDPPYAAFLRLSADSAVASLSPELFLRRTGSVVSSRPIKGTSARPAGEQDAAAARSRLERSAKNRAENVMIVDLMRNDLSRVCVPGSVAVPALVTAEPHPGVWHLVSEVRGDLCTGSGDGDLIRATFPPGSVTGAPKVRAIEIVHELEATPREVYTGAIGFRSPVAGLELNVAIRTFEFQAGHVWLGAGGGVVAASRPDDEYRECLVKAEPLVAAVGGSIARRVRRAPSPGPALRPRPAAGVFTSLLIRDGVAAGLDEHLRRLAGSARELYGKELPRHLRDDVARELAVRPAARLRITVRPLGGPLHATVECVPVGDRPAVADLLPVVIPGGVGGHKWADRRLLAHYAARAGALPGAQLLIEDADGSVLETDRANIFAVVGGVIWTPPADGRLLPGVTRAAILRLAAAAGLPACVSRLRSDDLRRATEMFVTNSVHGVLPVRSVAGAAMAAAPGPVTAWLTDTLAADRSGHRAPGVAEPGGPSRAASALAAARWPDHTATPARQDFVSGRRKRAAPTVIVIDNYDSFTYNLVHYLAEAGCAVEVVRNDEVTARQVMDFGPAGVVISPGPCAPTDAGISIDVVRAAATGIPVLGVCLGHQAIAASFGASVVPARRPVHGQTSLISHDGRGVLTGLPQRFTATRYHSLIVAEPTLPSVLRITARTGGGTPMGLRHETLPIEGVQFHPESVLTDYGHDIIGRFASPLGSPLSAQPR